MRNKDDVIERLDSTCNMAEKSCDMYREAKHVSTGHRSGGPGKYLRILRELVRLRMQQLMVFRLDFLAPFL